ncbi:unnamed protein product [Polarella glacialis]|uniref:Fe2OG dioxygenase domain-containing protein n=1 Tax=Polarella glacialis TaxID=89957 RepID=A0A813KMM9_POLGL|nr:unnamed protein product [Polarella glacialis]CAE8710871.1 unnamed protein product [Polarella glacialis]
MAENSGEYIISRCGQELAEELRAPGLRRASRRRRLSCHCLAVTASALAAVGLASEASRSFGSSCAASRFLPRLRIQLAAGKAGTNGRLPPTVAWGPPPEELPEELPDLEEIAAEAPNLRLGVLRNFLDLDEAALLHRLVHHPLAWEVKDRHSSLAFKHNVRRVEAVLRESARRLYAKLLCTAWAVDHRLWRSMRPEEYVLPQIEYIEYDVEKIGGEGGIGKHTDNGSLVSMVVLISDPADFEGGLNSFSGPPQRRVPLKPGDAVFFYGDKCEHWITPVTSGRRVILQMELQQSPQRLAKEQEEQRKAAGSRGGEKSRRGGDKRGRR